MMTAKLKKRENAKTTREIQIAHDKKGGIIKSTINNKNNTAKNKSLCHFFCFHQDTFAICLTVFPSFSLREFIFSPSRPGRAAHSVATLAGCVGYAVDPMLPPPPPPSSEHLPRRGGRLARLVG
jgi:hypothetical protein